MSELNIQTDIAVTRKEEVSFVSACQHFFTKPPWGKKIAISEFKALTQEDKEELREELIREGYVVRPLGVAA